MLEPRSPFPWGSCLGIVQILWNLAVQICSKQAVKKKLQIWYYLAAISHLLLHKRHTKKLYLLPADIPFFHLTSLVPCCFSQVGLGSFTMHPAVTLSCHQHWAWCWLWGTPSATAAAVWGLVKPGSPVRKHWSGKVPATAPQKPCSPLVWQLWQDVLVSPVVILGKKGDYWGTEKK